jgi:TadE-like protein
MLQIDLYKIKRKRQSGASLTEFVIVTPIAILLVFGIIQTGLIYMAKSTLNNAVFMAARHGANNHANENSMKLSLAKGLIPFYIDAFNKPDVGSMTAAMGKSTLAVFNPLLNEFKIISPNTAMYKRYGINSPAGRYIPNDNLEYRDAGVGVQDGERISIRDANILKIKFTYAYDITKVPLMATILRRIMCGGLDGSVDAWKNNSLTGAVGYDFGNCKYYLAGTIPIVSYATVQMQSNPVQ